MDRRIYVCAAVILVFGVIGYLLYSNFEIQPSQSYFPPSHEASKNNFLALERWLNEMGKPINYTSYFYQREIEEIRQKTAIIFASVCDWSDASNFFTPWIKNGNSLVICMVTRNTDTEDLDQDLLNYLVDFGIEVKTVEQWEDISYSDEPYFSWRFHFTIKEDADILTMKCKNDKIRLAELPIGEGTLTLIGYPVFMTNHNMREEKNARLAWKLTGERTDETGLLFVHPSSGDDAPKPLLGALMQRGNLLPVGVSTILLVLFGFWMVIPVFGLVVEEKQRSSKSIKERFTAEIGFLKKYKGLYYYLQDDYNQSNEYNYKEILNKLRSENDGSINSKH